MWCRQCNGLRANDSIRRTSLLQQRHSVHPGPRGHWEVWRDGGRGPSFWRVPESCKVAVIYRRWTVLSLSCAFYHLIMKWNKIWLLLVSCHCWLCLVLSFWHIKYCFKMNYSLWIFISRCLCILWFFFCADSWMTSSVTCAKTLPKAQNTSR